MKILMCGSNEALFTLIFLGYFILSQAKFVNLDSGKY